MDYTAIVAAADFTTALTAIGGVAVALAALYIGIRGTKIVLGFLAGRG